MKVSHQPPSSFAWRFRHAGSSRTASALLQSASTRTARAPSWHAAMCSEDASPGQTRPDILRLYTGLKVPIGRSSSLLVPPRRMLSTERIATLAAARKRGSSRVVASIAVPAVNKSLQWRYASDARSPHPSIGTEGKSSGQGLHHLTFARSTSSACAAFSLEGSWRRRHRCPHGQEAAR